MKTHLIAALAASALALAVMVPPPAAHADTATATTTVKKHTRHHPRMAARRVPAQHQIACTILGCNPIPSNCHPQMGYYGDGIPTGFDVVMCP